MRPRDNKTETGAKRRWSADDRARRDGSPVRRGADAAPGSRAARRDAEFGADRRRDDAPRTGGKPDRRTDWYPGPRQSPQRRTDDRGRTAERGERLGRASVHEDRPQRGERAFRETRPYREDRPYRGERPFREDRPGREERRDDRPFQSERPRREDRGARSADDRGARTAHGDRGGRPVHDDRGDRFARGDRFSSHDRPARDDRPARYDRPARDDRSASDDRTARFVRDDRAGRDDRPARDDRAARDDRPARDERARFDDGRRRDDRPRSGDRPRFGDRPRRDDRPVRFDAGPGARGPRTERRDPRPDQRARFDDRADRRPERRRDDAPAPYSPPEDVVLERLEAETVTADEVADRTFADLGLGQQITRALADLGATHPFPIQAATIPDALAGRNVLGRGRTGSGKTIAFGAAVVERLMRNWHESGRGGTGRQMGRAPRALVLAPTRELALQIDRTVQPIARAVGLYTTQVVGGVPQGRQVGALKKGVDIVIGTPGRIEDLHGQGHLDLGGIEVTVLDEADHMAELGFLEPMQRLLTLVPADGQRLLFSATLDAAVSTLVDAFLPEPAVHEVAEETAEGTAVHRVLVIEQGEKLPVLQALLSASDRSLVFARTRAFAEQLADDLEDAGVRTESLHGDLNQGRRTRNLQRFSEGRVQALVATDVAARGIHVDDVDLVVHADSAEDYKTYLHRSGRTGRAGAAGTVVTLITARRRRRFEELLDRAGIDAGFVTVRPGDDPVAALSA